MGKLRAVLSVVSRRSAGTALLAVVVVGHALRLTIRDRVPLVAMLYYALPLAVLAGLAVLAALVLPSGRGRQVATIIAAASVLTWGWCSWSIRGTEPSKKSIHVALWNVARGAAGWEAVVERVAELDADVIGLVETDDLDDAATVWDKAIPGREMRILPGGLTVIVNGEIGEVRMLPLHPRCTAAAVDVTVRGERCRIVLVDIYSAVSAPRRLPLTKLPELVPDDGIPTLVMGDFNTPPESAWFDSLRSRFRNAFEEAGTGYASTWPLPAPVLTLDQIWVDGGLEVEECRHEWTTRSDHRPVTCAVRVRQRSK